ncbi:DUF975 family protein [Alkalihalobacterium elongatum]|uniref:DUF975 family protein n=1 Tax=Alkalihalobacterium elongatum TaxID=2675466 RepID=UPI001C1FAB2A|nr:DUF975 family protein [Alkalihalobacterium elongatum]
MVWSVKQSALEVLKGNWFKVIGIIFVCYMIKVFLGTSRSSWNISSDGVSMTPLVLASSENILVIIAAAFFNSILFFAIVDLISHIKFNSGKKFFSAFIYSFKNPSLLYKGFIINAISSLVIFFFWLTSVITLLNLLYVMLEGFQTDDIMKFFFVLLIPIALLWVFLGLSQAMYILYEDPKTNVIKCVIRSFKMMNGNRWSLIGLYVSFVLWFFLGLIALVVGLLASLAFFEVSRFEYFQMLKRKERQKQWQGYFES